MTTTGSTTRLTGATAVALALLAAGNAQAALQDVGPVNPANAYPRYYRDLNGVAVEPCLAQTPSVDPLAGGAPMCFPLVPENGGWPGNFGMEVFYSNLTAIVNGDPNRGIKLKYVAALEASYATTTVPPTLTSGQEIVFSRVRVIIGTDTPGIYTVQHPYGVETFTVDSADLAGAGAVQGVPRAVFYTRDVGLTPGNFATALGGDMGPFPMWDTGPITMPNGEKYLGDPNVLHTITGTPFAPMLRIDGPPGSNLDGAGNDFLQTPLFTVLGKIYTAPIPQPLKITRAVYSRTGTVLSVDVNADATSGATLVLTGDGIPTTIMSKSGNHFYAHAAVPTSASVPPEVLVSNVTDVPVSAKTASLSDDVMIESAVYDPVSQNLTVLASSSDTSQQVKLTAEWTGFLGAMTRTVDANGAVTYTLSALAVIPPAEVHVTSSAFGHATAAPLVDGGSPVTGVPIAADFLTQQTNMNVAFTLVPSFTNSPSTVSAVYVVSPPAHGAAVVNGSLVTYTPALNYSGQDSFLYVARDANGSWSSTGKVVVAIAFVAPPPTAVADDFAVVNNGSTGACHVHNLLANDTILAPATIDAASVVITSQPTSGTVTLNPAGHAVGTVKYCSTRTGQNFTDSFKYTVANQDGTRSAPGSVFVDVRTGPESLSFSKIIWTAQQSKWTIVGSTNVFGPSLHPTVKLYLNGLGGRLLGTATIDQFGAYQFVTTGTVPGPTGTSYSVTAVSSNVPDPDNVTATQSGVKSQAGTFK